MRAVAWVHPNRDKASQSHGDDPRSHVDAPISGRCQVNTRKAATMSAEDRYAYIKGKLEQEVDETKPLIYPVRVLLDEGFDFNEVFDFIFPPRTN